MDIKGITLKPEFEKALLDLGFSEFTEIQEKCIPIIQAGRDVIGLSFTGSGKTAAFGFPTLERVNPGKGLQLLVVVPTRELCNQVAKEFRKFTKYRKTFIVEVYGGVSILPQIDHLRSADVVVGTPGRLLDHMSRNTINTQNVNMLVLDEADKMFEMGFIDDLRKIMSRIPRNSQKLLFSATMPQDILDIAKRYMNNPEKVKMQTYVDESKLIQHYYNVDKFNKFSLLMHVIRKEPPGLKLIFCSTRHVVDIISKNLYLQGVRAQAIHGGISQNKRKEVMDAFRDGHLDVLVASDVAARGLDIKNVSIVINYDLPKTSQDYVHRIGRTARAGSEGRVISLLSNEDHDNFRRILQDRSLMIEKIVLPEFEKLQLIIQKRHPRSHGDRPQGRGGYNRSHGSSNSRGRGGFSGNRNSGSHGYGSGRSSRR